MAYPIIEPGEGVAVLILRYRDSNPASSYHSFFSAWKITGTLPTNSTWFFTIAGFPVVLAAALRPLMGHTAQLGSTAFFAKLGGQHYQVTLNSGVPAAPTPKCLPSAVSMVWFKRASPGLGIGNGRFTLGCIREDYVTRNEVTPAGLTAMSIAINPFISNHTFGTATFAPAIWTPRTNTAVTLKEVIPRQKLGYSYRRYNASRENRPVPGFPQVP